MQIREKDHRVNQLARTCVAILAIVAASLLAGLEAVPVVPDTLAGAGMGGVIAAFVIYRAERGSGELDARRSREIAVR